jgi:hypothetical protein
MMSDYKDVFEKGSKEPRRHHYIPQFYLKNFENHNGKLFVLDMGKRRQWTSTPRDVACERDFYRVEMEGVDPNVIEKILSIIESEAAKVISGIIHKKQFPEGKDYDVLLYFIILLFMRTKRYLDSLSGFINDFMRGVQKMRFGSKGVEGTTISSEQYVKADWFDIFMEMSPKWRETLGKRQWTVHCLGKESKGNLVTSDNPVGLFWIDEDTDQAPGFAHDNTMVTLPLSPSYLLLGTIGKPFDPYDNTLSYAYFNWMTISNSRLIISQTEDFPILNQKGEIVSGKNYILNI